MFLSLLVALTSLVMWLRSIPFLVPRWWQCRRCKRHQFELWIGKIPWRRKWKLTPVFLPENSMDWEGWWAIVQRISELDMTDRLSISRDRHDWEHAHTHTHAHTRAHTHADVHTHMHTQTHRHTHTHTHPFLKAPLTSLYSCTFLTQHLLILSFKLTLHNLLTSEPHLISKRLIHIQQWPKN